MARLVAAERARPQGAPDGGRKKRQAPGAGGETRLNTGGRAPASGIIAQGWGRYKGGCGKKRTGAAAQKEQETRQTDANPRPPAAATVRHRRRESNRAPGRGGPGGPPRRPQATTRPRRREGARPGQTPRRSNAALWPGVHLRARSAGPHTPGVPPGCGARFRRSPEHLLRATPAAVPRLSPVPAARDPCSCAPFSPWGKGGGIGGNPAPLRVGGCPPPASGACAIGRGHPSLTRTPLRAAPSPGQQPRHRRSLWRGVGWSVSCGNAAKVYPYHPGSTAA